MQQLGPDQSEHREQRETVGENRHQTKAANFHLQPRMATAVVHPTGRAEGTLHSFATVPRYENKPITQGSAASSGRG